MRERVARDPALAGRVSFIPWFLYPFNFFYTSNLAFSRDLLDGLGGFDERFGHAVRSFGRRQLRAGAAAVIFARLHPELAGYLASPRARPGSVDKR